MGDNPYQKVKGGRLSFKGGDLATLSKSIDKKKKKKKNKSKDKHHEEPFPIDEASIEPSTAAAGSEAGGGDGGGGGGGGGGEVVYTIDAAKRMKYDELFPVEAKKFSYDPKAKVRSVADALDDRVKKKADRYCK